MRVRSQLAGHQPGQGPADLQQAVMERSALKGLQEMRENRLNFR